MERVKESGTFFIDVVETAIKMSSISAYKCRTS